MNLAISRLCVLLIFVLYSNNLFSQDYEIEVTNDICNSMEGSFHFTLNNNVFTFPLQLEYENLTSGEYFEIEIIGNDFILDNLSFGEYRFLVTLEENFVYEMCDEILNLMPFSEDDFALNIVNDICDTYAILEVEILNDVIDNAPLPYNLYISGIDSEYSNSLLLESITATVSNIPEGNYQISIRTSDNCEVDFDISVFLDPIEIQFEKTPSCDTDGTITSTVSGGESPYSFSWEDDSNENSANRTGLGSNLYKLIVTDANGCINSASGFIKNSDPIITENMSVFIGASECDAATGNIHIDIGPEGGSAPYTYSWSNDMTGQLIEDLGGGIYTLTITGYEGCSVIEEYEVPVEGLPTINSEVIESTCENQSTGLIAIYALTENGDLVDYLWSTGSTEPIIDDLSIGIYYLTLTDPSTGCSLEKEYELVSLNSAPIQISASTVANCTGSNTNDGEIHLSVNGGISPYYYQWNNGNTSKNLYNLSKGDYYVTVTDNCGSTESFTTYVDETNVEANSVWELSFGEITINTDPTGGESPYTFLWSNSETTPNIQIEDEGNYSVTVTDINGCIGLEVINITLNCDPLEIVLDGTSPGYDCNSPILIRFDPANGNSSVNGTAPFEIKIEQKENQNWVTKEYVEVSSLYELSIYQYTSTSAGTFKVSVLDNCGDKFEEVINGCYDCEYEFYNGGSNNDKVYVDIFQGLLTFEQVCPCEEDCDWGFTHDKIKLDVDKDGVENSILPWNDFNFKVIWPSENGEEPEETIITKSWIGNNKEVNVNGPTKYVLSTDEFNNGGVTVIVEYNIVENNTQVLQCQAEIPFEFGQKGRNGEFLNWQSPNNPFGSNSNGHHYYRGTHVCNTECTTPLVSGVLYANQPENIYDTNLIDCDDENPETNFFQFFPDNFELGCAGGGILRTHVEINGNIYLSHKYIGQNVAIDQAPSTIDIQLDNIGTECADYAVYRGYCLFEGIDVYGVEISRDLIAAYCSEEVFNPIPDADGDGIPDSEDDCPFNPDVFCDGNDDGGGTTLPGGGTVNPSGCVTNFHRDICQLSIVCEDQETQYVNGNIQTETFAGMIPCVHCFSADICRVTDPETGVEYSSIMGAVVNQVTYALVDDPLCSTNCAYQYTCGLTGEYLGTVCTTQGCSYSAEAWEPMCTGTEFEDIFSSQSNDDGTQMFEIELTPEQALEIIYSSRIDKSIEPLYLETFPNPSSQAFTLRVYSAISQKSEIKISNILGEFIYEEKINLSVGNNNFDVDINTIGGIYYISILTEDGEFKTIKHLINE